MEKGGAALLWNRRVFF
ncbi:hypothetical protein RDI58_012812 [Solanum bulbocastanum]|uniref:Uncharacterized protein n=1 Tax=Solanum bulbocastanum TaxID=147425 RepID=A0AAN8YH42_SOLBU